MKVTREKLKQIIKEELADLAKENASGTTKKKSPEKPVKELAK
jgi:hypothetical protein